MNILKKTLFSTLLVSSFIVSSGTAFAKDSDDFNRYQSAKIKINYEGEVGDLLQSVSNRLGVAYLAYRTDFSKKISINNEQPISIESLFTEVKKQVPNMEIGFEKIGETVTLTTYDSKSPLKLKNNQFIGEVIFGENGFGNQQEKTELTPLKSGNQLELVQPPEVQEEKANTEAQKKTLNNPEAPILAIPASDSPEAKALNDLVSRTTDEKLIARYKKKKAPKYKLVTDNPHKLAAVRVTNIGTFLIFDNQVDVSKFKIKGKFEATAQYGNVIGISHQKWVAPNKIEIVNENDQVLLLEKVAK